MLHSIYLIFSLLFVSSCALLAEKPIQDNTPKEPIQINPLYTPDVPDHIREAINKERLQEGKERTNVKDILSKEEFDEEEIEELEEVFASSPKNAQYIVNHLQDPTYFPHNKNYRSAMFVGAPGSGKTTMAKAIAYKMAKEGWRYKFLSSTSLLGEHRNQTAINLQKELEVIEASNKPTIIIVDELNKLLENADSKNHDTDSTSAALWTFLDRQNGNNNFFFIGTMNRADKLPQPFKDRILSRCINFKLITDFGIKNNILRKKLTTKSSRLDEDVTDEFLTKELEKIGPCAGRNLKYLSEDIHRINTINSTEKSSVMIITKASITQAVAEHIEQKTELKYDLKYETDEERQERHHQETLKMQDMHFTQQQINAIRTDNSISYADKNQFLSYYFTDKQIALYNEMMKTTLENRKKELAEAAKEQAQAEAKAAAEKAAKKARGWFQ